MDNILDDLIILYAEDDEQTRSITARVFAQIFKRVYTASDGVEALELYRIHKPDVVIADYEMPKMDGYELIKRIKEHDQSIPCMLFTACNGLIPKDKKLTNGIMHKPIDIAQFLWSIKMAVSVR